MNPTPKPKKPKSVARTQKPKKSVARTQKKQTVKKPKKSMKKGGVKTSITTSRQTSNHPIWSDAQWERYYSTLERRPERRAAFYDSRMYVMDSLYSAYIKTCELGNATSEACINLKDDIKTRIEKQRERQRQLKMNSQQPPIKEELRGSTTKSKRLSSNMPRPPDYVLEVKPQPRSSTKNNIKT